MPKDRLTTVMETELKRRVEDHAHHLRVNVSDVLDLAVRSFLDGAKASPAPVLEKPPILTADEELAVAALLDAMRDEDPSREALKSATLSGLKVWRDHVYQKKKAVRSRDQRKRA